MMNFFSVALILVFSISLFAQNYFEGSFAIEYKNEKKKVVKFEVKVKDKLIYLKNIQNGIAKYNYYVLNLATREFYTISKSDKKIILKYNIDKLMELYEKNELKENFKINPPLIYKATDKTREENGNKLIKYIGEDEIHRASFWMVNSSFNFNQLIPVLRLIGCWNEAQAKEGIIFNAEVSNKISKRESTVSLTMKKETISKDIFDLPKNYLQKDFEKMIEDEKNNKNLKTIVHTFAGF